MEAAQGRERLDQARQRASELMAERFAQSPPRGLLRALLDRAWSDVLALTLLRHGEESEAFRAQLAITDQLLGRLPTDDRLQLQQDVEAGLQQIGMHAEESVQVAQRLLGAGTPDPAVRAAQRHRSGAAPETTSAAGRASAARPHASEPQAALSSTPARIARPRAAQAREPQSARDRRIEQHLRESAVRQLVRVRRSLDRADRRSASWPGIRRCPDAACWSAGVASAARK